MARANSLIFPRSTVTGKGGYSLPTTDLSTWIGIRRVPRRSCPSRPTPPRRRGNACHRDRKSTRLNSSHLVISYAVFCLKKKKKKTAFLQRPIDLLARYSLRLHDQ